MMFRIQRAGVFLLVGLWLAAAAVMLFHNLAANPQVDTQLIAFALQFLKNLGTGHVADAFLEMRKYPLLPVGFLALLETKLLIILLLFGKIGSLSDASTYVFLHPAAFNFVARLLVLCAAYATIVMAHRSAKRFSPRGSGVAALVLLLGSIHFLTFATSVRPHMLVAGMTMTTFFLSLRYVERPTRGRELAAFAAAGLAFATLQSGIFAFFFPVWAYAVAHRGRWMRSFPRLVVLGLGGVLLATFLGYTHAIGFFAGRDVGYGLGLGNTDMDNQPWNGLGYASLFDLLLWSEPLLTLAASMGAVITVRARHSAHPMYWAAMIYVVFFCLFFGLNGNTAPRFFLPILPLLAVMGVPALTFEKSRRWKTVIFILGMILSCVVSIRFITLGLRPDTYQSVAAFLQTQTTGPVALQVPHYFLGIPPAREGLSAPRMEFERFVKNLPENLPGSRILLPGSSWKSAEALVAYEWSVPSETASNWTLCAEFPSAKGSDSVFLWGDVPGAFPRLLAARAMGPWLKVYCRKQLQ